MAHIRRRRQAPCIGFLHFLVVDIVLLAPSPSLADQILSPNISSKESGGKVADILGKKRNFVLRQEARNACTIKKTMSEGDGGNIIPQALPEDIGGGAINEKERNYGKLALEERVTSVGVTASALDRGSESDSRSCNSRYMPRSILSHSLHALAGLDRYPMYLSRWNEKDIDELEGALEELLDKVRSQRRTIEERQNGINEALELALERKTDDVDPKNFLSILAPPASWEELRYVLHPTAYNSVVGSKMFQSSKLRPPLNDVMQGKIKVDLDAALLEDWLDEEMFDVYSCQLFTAEFCAKIRDLIRHVASVSENHPLYCKLSLGRRPIDLDTIGLSWVNDLLFHLIIRPLSQHLFSQTESFDDLDWRQGYVTGYSAAPSASGAMPRQRLVSHTDDSEVTLNICLADSFQGGALQFSGLRGTPEEGVSLGEYEPEAGKALLHAGRHLHAVADVTEGDRYAFILWARSWGGLRKDVCPCCWLNRREGNTCICGPRWN